MPDPAVVPRALMVVALLGWFVLEVRQGRRTRPDATPADRGSLWVLRVTTALGILAAAAVAALAPGATAAQPFAAWASVVLVVTGAGLRWWSFRTLGQYFTFAVAVSPEQPVMEHGPYRLVRHPAYLGMLIALTGVALLIGNWLGLLAFEAVVVPGLVYRIRVEEQALASATGPRWATYAARTRRLVPFVW